MVLGEDVPDPDLSRPRQVMALSRPFRIAKGRAARAAKACGSRLAELDGIWMEFSGGLTWFYSIIYDVLLCFIREL